MKKRIVFITGTRADYGKIKSLLKCLESNELFEVFIFVCGMHLSDKFGATYHEVLNDGYKNVHIAKDILLSADTSTNLGNTINSFSRYLKEINPDMVVVHGDRVDALAGAIVGALQNVLVGHIEGGELSGTIDESLRHAISKLSHIHFVCTSEAKNRLIQLGEEENRIFVIGSPDIDLMLGELPPLIEAKERYNITFDEYSIFMYHPVTTEIQATRMNIKKVLKALIESNLNYVVIYPNNDLGSDIIIDEFGRLNNLERFRVFPSIRFEYFLTLFKNSKLIIGNSSAGVRESGVFGVPAIDIGSRQEGRYKENELPNVQHVTEDTDEILRAIKSSNAYAITSNAFGSGESTKKFISILQEKSFWELPLQKKFIDKDY